MAVDFLDSLNTPQQACFYFGMLFLSHFYHLPRISSHLFNKIPIITTKTDMFHSMIEYASLLIYGHDV